MWWKCARCGRTDTELMEVMSTSRRTALPMCRDDRLCYPKKEQKNNQLCQAGIQKLKKLNYRQFTN